MSLRLRVSFKEGKFNKKSNKLSFNVYLISFNKKIIFKTKNPDLSRGL